MSNLKLNWNCEHTRLGCDDTNGIFCLAKDCNWQATPTELVETVKFYSQPWLLRREEIDLMDTTAGIFHGKKGKITVGTWEPRAKLRIDHGAKARKLLRIEEAKDE